jgi:CheY-like chemotaxis protein
MRRILLVDSHPDSREALVTLCQVSGYEVAESTGPFDALAKTAGFRPDVVVVDLPGTGACRVARGIRESGDQKSFIIALTASRRADERRQALDAGCDAVLLKPGELTEFYQLLADETRQRRPLGRRVR